MSRAAVHDALRLSSELSGIIPAETNVVTNYSREGRPNQLQPGGFIVLRWESIVRAFKKIAGPRDLTVWAHWPDEMSSDFGHIDKTLDCVKEILCNLEDVAGADGYTITSVEYAGESGDLKDDGFHTIARNMTFRVLSRPT